MHLSIERWIFFSQNCLDFSINGYFGFFKDNLITTFEKIKKKSAILVITASPRISLFFRLSNKMDTEFPLQFETSV